MLPNERNTRTPGSRVCEIPHADRWDPLGVAALCAAAFCGPIHKPAHLVAVLPHQVEEFARGHVRGFLAKERLEPPAQIRTLPRRKAVAARNAPIMTNRFQHKP